MKCPKCNYISFDSPERCRHCGYDFAMPGATAPIPDLPLRDESGESVGLPQDLPLSEGGEGPHGGGRTPRAGAPQGALELPLFGQAPGEGASEAMPAPRAPRPPLSVRRASSDLARHRGSSTATPAGPPRLDFVEPPEAEVRQVPPIARPAPAAHHEVRAAPSAAAAPPGRVGRRVAGGLVDALLLGAIDAVVLHFTLQLTGLDLAGFSRLPLPPLLAFVVLLNGGYLVVFTLASGQTIGQMVAGVRVVDAVGGHVTVGTALARACGLVLSWALAGSGFLPMFLSPDRRALHDRLAGTRVVRD